MANFDFLLEIDIFRKSLSEQKAAIKDFWKKGGQILEGSGVSLRPLPEDWTDLRHNYFSVLFTATFFILKVPLPRLRLYARLNHCLRSWVTACDNLLDNELKEMLLTSLPENAATFKSVHTVLTVDRIFFSFLLDGLRDGTITNDEMEKLLRVSLASLSASGIEEAGEEGGVDCFLPPEEVLQKIHPAKTGRLFTSPLAAPAALGDITDNKTHENISSGLCQFGLACQVLDDLSDLGMDLANRKHNYLASLIMHSNDLYERQLLEDTVNSIFSGDNAARDDIHLYMRFPIAAGLAQKEALSRFNISLEYLAGGGIPFSSSGKQAFIRTLTAILGHPDLLVSLRGQ